MDRIIDVFREDQSSYQFAKETTDLIKQLATKILEKENGVGELWKLLCEFRKRLIALKPLEFSISNTVKKVLSIIRDEAKRLDISIDEGLLEEDSKEIKYLIRRKNFLYTFEQDEDESPTEKKDGNQKYLEFKESIVSVVDELLEEFDNLTTLINAYAPNNINANDVILTFGSSYTIQQFLISAAAKKNFEVIVVENNLKKNGHKMAEKLAEAGIKTTVITDTAIFAVIPRVHKAILSPHSILVNGGIISSSGSLLMAMACKAHHIPLIVVGGIYKLTPKISFDQDTYNDLLNPGEFLTFGDSEFPENIEVIIPGLDYIGPEYVTLYITNEGEHTPAYIYRVFSELYLSS